MSIDTTLTLEQLDDFLGANEDSDTQAPFCEAASVLAVFDPLALRAGNAPGATAADVLPLLRPLCDVLTADAEKSRWSLRLPERRKALRRLETRMAMRAALSTNPDRERTALQLAFERVLIGPVDALDDLPRDELASMLTVREWLEGIVHDLPDAATVRRLLRRRDLLAPMRRLTQGGFVGRAAELAQLHRFVNGSPPMAPLFVHGPGGVGKSTLLGRFVLDQVDADDPIVAYLDIDRPTIRPEQPETLLLDALRQIQSQLDIEEHQIESLSKELEYSLRRVDPGRGLESANSGGHWVIDLFMRSMLGWTQGRRILFVIDTCEEVQFLGSDVTWPFMDFVHNIQAAIPTIRIVLSGRTLPTEYLQLAFRVYAPSQPMGDLPSIEHIPDPMRPIGLDVLDVDSARLLLRQALQAAGVAPPADANLDEISRIVSGNPMCLKLAARVLQDEGVGALRDDHRTGFFIKLRGEKIQALLYGRILRHLHSDGVRKVAYPGLVVRRIDAAVLTDVLAQPCGLTFDAPYTPHTMMQELAREVALVQVDPADGSLRHRPDVRRTMLLDLTDHIEPAVVEAIDSLAVEHYAKLSGPVARAEEIYHRLRLRQPADVVGPRWISGVGERLKGALDELAPEQKLWLAERLNVTLDDEVRHSADQAAWEAQAARISRRHLLSNNPEGALRVLAERDQRLPRSALYAQEAEAYRFLGRSDEALRVARRGVEAATADGAIDMALELLLHMAVIQEGGGDDAAAEATVHEAEGVAKHSGNRMLRLRCAITVLRLHRKLHPEARDGRAELRSAARFMLSDDMLQRLREQPVLLREAAAELAVDEPRLAAAAIETLGIEVVSDEQASAFGRAFAESDGVQKWGSKLLASALQTVVESNFDSGVVRKVATEILTSRDTRRLGAELLGMAAGTDTLRKFRDYFRVGVSDLLSSDPARRSEDAD